MRCAAGASTTEHEFISSAAMQVTQHAAHKNPSTYWRICTDYRICFLCFFLKKNLLVYSFLISWRVQRRGGGLVRPPASAFQQLLVNYGTCTFKNCTALFQASEVRRRRVNNSKSEKLRETGRKWTEGKDRNGFLFLLFLGSCDRALWEDLVFVWTLNRNKEYM